MIFIQNRVRTIDFDVAAYEKKAATVLEYLNYTNFDLNILITTNRTVKKYNHQYRDKNKATDILSFPYHTELKAGEKIQVKSDDDQAIGDIIIALEYVYKNRHNLEGTFVERMDRMLVHGICHCLGYDHMVDEDYKVMYALEKKLLALIQK